ncbi:MULTISPECIES: fused MFS/spermidine synthase [unclassified Beijerinckia]|uniref:fused MFS/spermidine synthase n=1 Tax=unclassified Beijerinckia TaxID=2638183 RepID=UPI0008969E53|nr:MULTISPECIES: fused MFS/spermidine synthase [unclassified Beijerinckia]MDH7799861.1 spermidine synthase [Beijerinckia sp. GAS462]SED40181.1 Spermidine synthase [Beijerinckia sp. 28-YEA-48]
MTLARADQASTRRSGRRTTRSSARANQARIDARTGESFPALFLFLSGIAALICQVLWIKQLSLVVGVDVYAVTIGVSAFFTGLAIGGLVFGRMADRTAHPLRLYAALEGGVAVLAVAATLGLAQAAPLFASLEQISPLLAWTLVFALVGIPAILMGGTLPALTRYAMGQRDGVGAIGGRLYAANTAGAITGALLSSFLIIPTAGMRGSAFVAAGLCLAAALLALAVGRTARPAQRPAPEVTRKPQATRLSREGKLALGLYAIAGGIALGYEVVWSQAIVPFMSTRSFAFSILLATYLAGLAIGAALFARRADRIARPWSVFGLLIAGAGLAAILPIALLGPWLIQLQSLVEAWVLQLTGSAFAGMSARFAVAAICVVLPATILLGAAFPAALRLAVAPGQIGRGVGFIVAGNTFGGILGTALTGFILVPALGLVRSLAVLAIAAAAIGMIAALREIRAASKAWLGTVVIGGLACVTAFLLPADRLAALLPGASGANLISYEEGLGGTVAVVERGAGRNRFRRLYIQGVSNSGDAMPSLRYMRLQALLPLIIHNGEPKSALVIGFGTGITAGALLTYPGLERRVVAELLPSVVRAASAFDGNFQATRDPRLDIRLRDGRRELLRNSDHYDLITLEPPPPSAAGVVNLYSSDFYSLARSRLTAQGLVAQWLPLPTQNDEDTRSLVRSFLDVFPHATLWTTELHEMLLIGSQEPVTLDLQRITQRLGQPEVAKALADVGIASPAALLATFVTDRAGLERYAGAARPVTDNDPRIEYAGWVRRYELNTTLPALMDMQRAPVIIGADDPFKAALATETDTLLTFYDAGLAAYAGERVRWARQMRQVAQAAPENSYYRWFTGGMRE